MLPLYSFRSHLHISTIHIGISIMWEHLFLNDVFGAERRLVNSQGHKNDGFIRSTHQTNHISNAHPLWNPLPPQARYSLSFILLNPYWCYNCFLYISQFLWELGYCNIFIPLPRSVSIIVFSTLHLRALQIDQYTNAC